VGEHDEFADERLALGSPKGGALSGESGSELERSIASEELARLDEAEIDIAFNVTEGLGAVASDEILPEIPIVKSLYALVKTSKAISNALPARKVVRFLFQLREISPNDRQAFLAKLEGDERERIVDSLILVLDRHEVLRKSEIQGRLFAALIQEDLSKAEYLTLTHATTTIDVDSLPVLRNFYGGVAGDARPSTALLYGYGFLQLLEIDNSSVGTYGEVGLSSFRTSLERSTSPSPAELNRDASDSRWLTD